jgi:hypothetical protein
LAQVPSGDAEQHLIVALDNGEAIAATQILLPQAPQVIDEITEAFDLTGGEKAFLLAAERGEVLLCGGGSGSDRTRSAWWQAASNTTWPRHPQRNSRRWPPTGST